MKKYGLFNLKMPSLEVNKGIIHLCSRTRYLRCKYMDNRNITLSSSIKKKKKNMFFS